MATAAPSPVVFTPRPDVIQTLQRELQGLGAPAAVAAESRDRCIEMLLRSPLAPLVLDWELGSETVNAILGAVRGYFKVEIRPILMLIPSLEQNIIAIGAEYGVSQLHAGAVTSDTLSGCLRELFREDSSTRDVRDTLVQVATARSKGDWAIATPLLQQLHDRQPDQDRILVELAENLIHENSWDEAAELLAPLAVQDPPNVRALHLLGRCYMRRGDFDRAIELLQQAKLINPHNVERLIELGHVFLSADQIADALQSFKDALTVDEGNKEATAGVGQSLLMAGEVNEALGLLKEISGPRELASIFNSAAILSMRQERFDHGMQLYRAALAAIRREDRVAARLLFNMGLGYKRWGKPDRAVVCFERALALDPTYTRAAQHKDAASRLQPPPEDRGAFDEEQFSQEPSPAMPLPDAADLPEPEPEPSGED